MAAWPRGRVAAWPHGRMAGARIRNANLKSARKLFQSPSDAVDQKVFADGPLTHGYPDHVFKIEHA